ncbi:MAG: amidohydrolase [Burkholderiaceae bacterium]
MTSSGPCAATPGARPTLTIFPARRIITMDESLPQASAVGVIEGRIVAVGDMDSMRPWQEGREVVLDERFRDKVLMPGLIDNHIHPFLGAILMPMEIIAPEAWRQPDGSVLPAAGTPAEYRELLQARLKARTDTDELFISFGYQPALHGRWFRQELDALCPDRPVILWQRSFHETYLNSCAIERLGLDRENTRTHPQVKLEDGHFFETGNKLVMASVRKTLMAPQWYRKGLAMTADLMQQGGITTAGDMLFGSLGPEFEMEALDEVIETPGRPMRIVNVFDFRGFSNRATGRPMGPPDAPIDFSAGLQAIGAQIGQHGKHVLNSRAVKLFADGAMFSQLMQMRPPGYIDGHHGEWLMSPEVLDAGIQAAWDAGLQIHVHVNGDAGMDAVIDALSRAQARRPRFDHRFHVHHVGYCSAAQIPRLAALGAHASVNPYYIHALADDYSVLGLGPERGSQISRCGSMLRAGMKVSFHSDFIIAPPEPLLLAWCAANRFTRSGAVASPTERLTLEQALRGITIDAAWALGLESEIGSIACGKRADFAILEDDPFELGVERLKDVRVAGTIFEGTPHLLARPVASLHASHLDRSVQGSAVRASSRRGASAATGRYQRLRPVVPGCCGPGIDRCDLIRQWPQWLGPAVPQARPASLSSSSAPPFTHPGVPS